MTMRRWTPFGSAARSGDVGYSSIDAKKHADTMKSPSASASERYSGQFSRSVRITSVPFGLPVDSHVVDVERDQARRREHRPEQPGHDPASRRKAETVEHAMLSTE